MRIDRFAWALAGLVLATAVAAPFAMPRAAAAAAPAEAAAALAETLSPADRDLLSRVRSTVRWEVAAGDLARKQTSNAKLVEVSDKIVNELGGVDQLLGSVAGSLGVTLPDEPNTEQRGYLAELAAAREAEFDRVFVDRLRAENGRLFSVIAGVRAGTRSASIRSFSASASDFVLRHMTFLETTGLVNFVTLPSSDLGVAGAATVPDAHGLDPADRDLLASMRLAALWGQRAGQLAQEKATNASVRATGSKIVTECAELSDVVGSIAAAVGLAVPDRPNSEQQGWLDEIAAAQGEGLDRAFVDRLRADDGRLLSIVAGVRSGTRNSVIRPFAAKASAALLRHMLYLEGTGLVDFEALPLPPLPVGQRISGLQRENGVNLAVIWLVLATAGLVGAVTIARLLRSVLTHRIGPLQ